MVRALIVGDGGQDGRILWDQLAARGCSLVGVSRGQVRAHLAQWDEITDITDAAAVRRLLSSFRPDQIYYLAAHHHSSQERSFDELANWQASWSVHTQGFLHVLSAVRDCQLPARIFYASSSRVFGQAAVSPQAEDTPMRPGCIYGATKAMGMMLADYHRRNHQHFVSCGILYNHESPLRGPEFVSQRIANGLVALKTGRINSLHIGSLDARVDWGHAADYTRAMQLILEADAPGDFVVASGETHSVRDMIEIAAEFLELQWHGRVFENPQILGRSPQDLCGNPSLLRRTTGWQPAISFRDMVEALVKAALSRSRLEP
jgi:GDPmannose 4,6-dehydratase